MDHHRQTGPPHGTVVSPSPAQHDVEKPTRRPTLKDVATRAGVSVSTASLAFSGRGPVATATAERVHVAADELGYAGPDPMAASLRRGRAEVIAVVVEGSLPTAFRDPFALTVLGGLAQALDEGGSSMLLVAQDPDRPERVVEQLSTQAIDAAIFPFCGPRENPLVDALVTRGIPIIGTGAPDDARVVQVLTDERAGMALGAQHLADLGHTRVGHIAMPLSVHSPTAIVCDDEIEGADYPDARLRALGFRDVFGPRSPIAVTSTPDVTQGERAAALLLDLANAPDERITAIVCQSDLLAAGGIRAAHARGLRVPEDLSIVGFDGVDLPWLDTDLTTVVQDGPAKGRILGASALAAADEEPVESVTVEVTLHVGQTTAAPPG